jgi:hypothetical protein
MTDRDIIARRELVRDGRAYEVQIERPCADDETGTFFCRWSLVDDSGEALVTREMWGADSAAALIYTVLIIGERIELESDQFTFLGSKGTHFPRYPSGDEAWFMATGDSP